MMACSSMIIKVSRRNEELAIRIDWRIETLKCANIIGCVKHQIGRTVVGVHNPFAEDRVIFDALQETITVVRIRQQTIFGITTNGISWIIHANGDTLFVV